MVKKEILPRDWKVQREYLNPVPRNKLHLWKEPLVARDLNGRSVVLIRGLGKN